MNWKTGHKAIFEYTGEEQQNFKNSKFSLNQFHFLWCPSTLYSQLAIISNNQSINIRLFDGMISQLTQTQLG